MVLLRVKIRFRGEQKKENFGFLRVAKSGGKVYAAQGDLNS